MLRGSADQVYVRLQARRHDPHHAGRNMTGSTGAPSQQTLGLTQVSRPEI